SDAPHFNSSVPDFNPAEPAFNSLAPPCNSDEPASSSFVPAFNSEEPVCNSLVPDFNSLDFFFQAEDGIRDRNVTGVQTCALPILSSPGWAAWGTTSWRIRVMPSRSARSTYSFTRATCERSSSGSSMERSAPIARLVSGTPADSALARMLSTYAGSEAMFGIGGSGSSPPAASSRCSPSLAATQSMPCGSVISPAESCEWKRWEVTPKVTSEAIEGGVAVGGLGSGHAGVPATSARRVAGDAGGAGEAGGAVREAQAERAQEGAVGGEPGGHHLGGVLGHQQPADGAAQRGQQGLAGAGETAADDDPFGIDGEQHRGQARGDLRTELLDLLDGAGVPGGGALEELLGVVARGPGEPAAHGAVGPAHAALAAQLTGQAMGALQDRAAHDHGDGDAVPELDQHDAVGGRPEMVLGE